MAEARATSPSDARLPGSTVTDDVLAVFADRVARYKAPQGVVWVDSLPRTAMGTVQKHLLRDAVSERATAPATPRNGGITNREDTT